MYPPLIWHTFCKYTLLVAHLSKIGDFLHAGEAHDFES